MEEKDLTNIPESTEVRKGWWSKKDKKDKKSFVLMIIFVLLLVAALFTLVYCRQLFGDEVADLLIGVGVPNGWHMIGIYFTANALTLVISIIVILTTFVIYYVLKGIIKSVTRKTQRTKTIGSLIVSVLRYVSIIVDIAVILTLWGVNLASAVAGVSILAIIIGFGCKNLVADIVSGLFIVFDDYFAVGDAVIIDGFRGYVTEIGLRTVKIDDRLGNIKCIANSNIQTCVNLSRTINIVSVSMEIGYNEDIERVEAILSEELPKIKDRCPKMIEAPFYKGVEALTNSGVEISFGVKCRYPDRFGTTRDLRRELYQIFKNNDIYFTFQQIVINNADPKDRPIATEEQIDLSQELVAKTREITVDKKEKSFIEKTLGIDIKPIQPKKSTGRAKKKTKKKK